MPSRPWPQPPRPSSPAAPPRTRSCARSPPGPRGRTYVDSDEAGTDLKVFVRLIADHGTAALIHATNRLSDEESADLTISTAHKAKGREWHTVQIADDFRQPQANEDGNVGKLPAAEAMLVYVAVTRAQHVLDRGGLAWIDDHLAGIPAPTKRKKSRAHA